MTRAEWIIVFWIFYGILKFRWFDKCEMSEPVPYGNFPDFYTVRTMRIFLFFIVVLFWPFSEVWDTIEKAL